MQTSEDDRIIRCLDGGYFRDYSIGKATPQDFLVLEEDVSESDKFELGKTWRNDWREELRSTRDHCSSAYVVRMADAEGVLIFGHTVVKKMDADVIWMLQSESFRSAMRSGGLGWALRLRRGTCLVLNLMSQDGRTLFNFIPADQLETIRWLKQLGLVFCGDPTGGSTSVYMFGTGPKFEALASDQMVWSAFR